MRAIRTVITTITVLLVPVILLMTSIRLAFTPLYPAVEYNMPYFPPDPYGFTTEERLHYTTIAINYLNNNEDISYLSELSFPDGSPLFNERELSHMVDVQNVYQGMIRWWIVLSILLLVLGLIAWRAGWLEEFWRSISYGGWLTIGLIVAILLTVAISFRQLFTAFHMVFFEGDTWLFNYSDTLIRLLPLEFWRDGFILVGLLTAIGGVLLGWGGRKLANRWERA